MMHENLAEHITHRSVQSQKNPSDSASAFQSSNRARRKHTNVTELRKELMINAKYRYND